MELLTKLCVDCAAAAEHYFAVQHEPSSRMKGVRFQEAFKNLERATKLVKEQREFLRKQEAECPALTQP
jgi:hypothetical protein